MTKEELEQELSKSEIEHFKAQILNLKAQTETLRKPFWHSVQFWTILSGLIVALIGYTSTWQSQAAKDMNALVQMQLTTTKEKLADESNNLAVIKLELAKHKQELETLMVKHQGLVEQNQKLEKFNAVLGELTLENRERISALIFNELIESREYLTEKLIDKEGDIGPQDIGESFAYIITKALIYRDIEVNSKLVESFPEE
ncbi:hypothetical protein [Vibrio sp. V01_P9A10T6]|uniref:hypothetical protein n=1 Tax=Vibrio sp. V01_P9A10T6 TaxID=2116368 RepID=UPI000D039B90|nr:hypothetical protein [Vibrio sp. V01_P9A10T6]PRQ63261.1 hypothetical protein BWR16_06100 [Vibrio sp. V01_P9A10T6]